MPRNGPSSSEPQTYLARCAELQIAPDASVLVTLTTGWDILAPSFEFGEGKLLPLLDVLASAQCRVKRLVLRSQGIGPAGGLWGGERASCDARVLGEALLRNRSVTDLDLASCGLRDLGVCEIARALEASPTIERVDLRRNAFGKEGCEALRDAIVRGKEAGTCGVRELDVSMNGLGHKTVSLMRSALVQHGSGAARPAAVGAVLEGAPGAGGVSEALSDASDNAAVASRDEDGDGAAGSVLVPASEPHDPPSSSSSSSAWGLPRFGLGGSSSSGPLHALGVWYQGGGAAEGGGGPGVPSSSSSSAKKRRLLSRRAEPASTTKIVLRIEAGNYTTEELLNALTHGVGCCLALVGTIPLLSDACAKDRATFYQCLVYSATLVACFASSCSYHACFMLPRAFKYLQRADHAAIYLLIAGSYTPFMGCGMRGHLGATAILVLVWLAAGVGCMAAAAGVGLDTASAINAGEVVGYAAMGLAVVPIIADVHARYDPEAFGLLVLGGAAYLIGIVPFALGNRYPFLHVVWHLFVLTGAVVHWFCVYLHVIPMMGGAGDPFQTFGPGRSSPMTEPSNGFAADDAQEGGPPFGALNTDNVRAHLHDVEQWALEALLLGSAAFPAAAAGLPEIKGLRSSAAATSTLLRRRARHLFRELLATFALERGSSERTVGSHLLPSLLAAFAAKDRRAGRTGGTDDRLEAVDDDSGSISTPPAAANHPGNLLGADHEAALPVADFLTAVGGAPPGCASSDSDAAVVRPGIL